MSNLKSKFFLGLMVLATVAFIGASQAAASTAITHTLRAGSTYTAEVKVLQADLGITADGKFGPMTTAAVKAFQTKNGLTADGVFGPKSLAALGGSTTTTTTTTTTTSSTQAGCVAGGAFSSTTGLPCTTVTSVSGCAAGALFSATTGMSCSGAGVSSVSSTGEGTLTLQSAPVSVTTNPSQGDSKDTVLAFGLKATGSNVTVNRVNVSIASTNSLPWSYFTTLYLYNGGSLLATLPVNNNTLTQNTFGANYTASFQGLSSVIPVDQTASFIVKADIASTIPAASSFNNVYVFGLNDQSTSQVVRSTDGAGLSEYVGSTSNYNQTLTLGTSGNGTLSVTIDNSNPIGNNVVEQSNQTATGVTALVFDLKNTSNNTATVESITVHPTSTWNQDVSAWYLYNGGSSIQSLGNQSCTIAADHSCADDSSANSEVANDVVFDNFTPFTIAPNSSTVMTVKFDAASSADGPVSVSVTGATGVSALLNNTLTAVTGSAVGNTFVLLGTNGVSVNLVGSPTFTTYPATVSGTTGYTTGTFTFAVSPVGVSLVDLSKAGAVTVVGALSSSNANGVINTAAGTDSGYASDGTWLAGTVVSSNYIVSPVLTNGISDGNTANITVVVNRTDTGAGNQTFSIAGLRFAETGWGVGQALTTDNSVSVTGGLSNATVTGYSNQ